jgi:hypothetical protein
MTWFRRTSQPEPDLGPTKEELEGGFESADAWPGPDPDPWLTPEQEAYQQAQAQDALDLALGAAEWRQAIGDYFAAQRQAAEYEPEAGS